MSDALVKNFVGSNFGGYVVTEKIAQGGFGIVFAAKKGEKFCVIKVDLKPKNTQLETENDVYSALQKNSRPRTGFPWKRTLAFYGKNPMLIIERCGPDLSTLLRKTKSGFSRKTVIMIAIQLLYRLETLHGVGYLHRDIKPSNILVGLHKDRSTLDTLYLIDFGNAKKYKSESGYIIKPGDENGSCAGTTPYASIRWHTERVQSCRDDLISMIYVLSQLLHKTLPWANQNGSVARNIARLVQCKAEVNGANLFPGCPNQFIEMFQYVHKLSFKDKIDYTKLRHLMRKALTSLDNRNQDEAHFEWREWENERIYSS